jgi:hypothetical protein
VTPKPDIAGGGLRFVAAGILLTALVGAALGVDNGPQPTAALLTGHGEAATNVRTAPACASGTPYQQYLQALAPGPTLWWRFGEAAGAASAADASGNGNPGTVIGAQLGGAGLVQCDATGALGLPGGGPDTGLVYLPGSRPAPKQLTVALWLQAAPGSAGGLFTFADAAASTATTTDRSVAITAAGRVSFTIETTSGTTQLSSSVVDGDVADGRPHLVVATLGPGAGVGVHDVRLYLDGQPVDGATGLTLPPSYTGYWRTGSGTGAAAPAALDEISLWEGAALDATQVAALAAADHW